MHNSTLIDAGHLTAIMAGTSRRPCPLLSAPVPAGLRERKLLPDILRPAEPHPPAAGQRAGTGPAAGDPDQDTARARRDRESAVTARTIKCGRSAVRTSGQQRTRTCRP